MLLVPALPAAWRPLVVALVPLWIGWNGEGGAQQAAGPDTGVDSFDRALALYGEGRTREAAATFVAAGALLLQNEAPGLAAVAFSNGCLTLQELGRFDEALTACERSLEIRRVEQNQEELAIVLNNLGLVLQSLGRPDEASERFEEALGLNRQMGLLEGQIVNWTNLGIVDWQRGHYRRARERLLLAIDLGLSRSDQAWARSRVVAARLNLGAVLERTGAYREALDLYRELLERPGELVPRDRAAALVNQGVIYRNLGDPVTAMARFEVAAGLYGGAGDTAGEASALLNQGLALYLNLGRLEEGARALGAAQEAARRSGDLAMEVEALLHLGEIERLRGRRVRAAELFHRCLELSESGDLSEGRWSALYGLGRLAELDGDLDTSWRRLEGALHEVERVRESLAAPSTRASYLTDKREVYVAAVQLLARLAEERPREPWAELALSVVQRAKARALLDALAMQSSPLPPLDAARVRARLAPGTPLVELFLGETALFRFLVTREAGVQLEVIPGSRELLELTAAVHAALARGERPDGASLERLATAVLPTAIREQPPRDLIVAPDGRLRYLPFEILPVVEPSTSVVERTVVRYLTSGSALGERPRGERPRPRLRLLGLGAPARSPTAGAPRRPLPLAVAELQRAADALGGESRVAVGDRATVAELRDGLTQGVEVLHLAAHTTLDERTGLETAIELAPGTGDDGLLTPPLIAALAGARLTVLSACSTALGYEEDGQALDSLVGSFFSSGSEGVVATLWDVGDQTAAVLMDLFYRRLARHGDAARALAEAKRAALADDRWSDPSLWSGFVLVGNPSPVRPRSRSPQGLVATGIGALLVALVLQRLGSRRERQRRAR